MFTGIVQGVAEVVSIVESPNTRTMGLSFAAPLLRGLETGASVSVDGVCLTATEINNATVKFDLILSTLTRTTLAEISVGARVNIERSLTQTSELGGHEVSGHVDTTGILQGVETPSGNRRLVIKIGLEWIRYFVSRGFVAVNGVSLTVGEVDKYQGLFDVWLIPETLRRTNLATLTTGDRVNIEVHKGFQVVVDAVGEAVERVLTRFLAAGELRSDQIESLIRLTHQLSNDRLLVQHSDSKRIERPDSADPLRPSR